MPGVLLWAWDATNNKWIKVEADTGGRLYVVSTVAELNDIGDVNVPTPADEEFLFWDNPNSEWAARALVIADIPTAIKTLTITFIIDGGGSAITTGEKGHLEIPFACTITGWTILADQSGSIVVDVWKDTYALFPPTVADTIAGTEKPTLVTAQKNQDLDLTTWTTAIAAGDILAFYVESITTVERVTISLKVVKT